MRRVRLAGQLAEPISHYTDAVEADGFLYISGMLPVNARHASTLVEVSALAHPDALVEIEAVALLPRRDGHEG